MFACCINANKNDFFCVSKGISLAGLSSNEGSYMSCRKIPR